MAKGKGGGAPRGNKNAAGNHRSMSANPVARSVAINATSGAIKLGIIGGMVGAGIPGALIGGTLGGLGAYGVSKLNKKK